MPRSFRLACGLVATLILTAALHAGGAGARTPTPRSDKAKKPATFPHSGTIRIPSTSATAAAGASLAPGMLFRSSPPETLDWGPTDTTRTLTVSVTDRRGRVLTANLGFPLSVPVTFRLTGKPPGVAGAALVNGATRDTAEVVVGTSGLRGNASARLVRGDGIGRYEVTASLPAEFLSLPGSGTLPFITLTEGTTAELANLTIEQGHLANGRDSALIDVDAKDFLGAAVNNASLRAILRVTDNAGSVPLAAAGSGHYRGHLASNEAGSRVVEVFDQHSDAAARALVQFTPRAAERIELKAESDMVKIPGGRSIQLSAAVIDSGGNLLDAASRPVLFTTLVGSIGPMPPDTLRPWAHLATLSHNGLGTAEVTARDQISGLTATMQVVFPAVSLGRGVPPVLHLSPPELPSSFTLPLRLYVPPGLYLDSARVTVNYPSHLVSAAGFTDADPHDVYPAQIASQTPGQFTVFTRNVFGPPQTGEIDLMNCAFDCEAPDSTFFTFNNVSMYGTDRPTLRGRPSDASALSIPLPTTPAEEVAVFQKQPTKRICLNIIVSTACKGKTDWINDAGKELQKALNQACCTILIDKQELCFMDLGSAGESEFKFNDAGDRETRLSNSNLGIIKKTQPNDPKAKCKRKNECVNMYIVEGINTRKTTGGPAEGGEEGEADVPNHFDGQGNVHHGSLRDHDGKKTGLDDKSTSSAFVKCGADKDGFTNTFMHEFGHMMGLDHSEATKAKDDDGADNAMHKDKNPKGKVFSAKQCEQIMQDINGYCLELQK